MAKHMRPKRNKPYRAGYRPPASGLTVIALKNAISAEAQATARHFAQPLQDDQATDIYVGYWMAFNQMVAGESDEGKWCTVACSLNIALVLAERGVGQEYEPHIVKGLDGAFRAKLRAARLGAWRYDGEAITAIRDALEVHDEQIKLVSKQEMRDALKEVHRRIEAGHAYEAVPA